MLAPKPSRLQPSEAPEAKFKKGIAQKLSLRVRTFQRRLEDAGSLVSVLNSID